MKYTENFKLKKPEATDAYNIEDFNENSDAVDAKLKELSDLLTVEDISDSFATLAASLSGAQYMPKVYKVGSLITGNVTCFFGNATQTGPNISLVEITDKYRPKASKVVAQTFVNIEGGIANHGIVMIHRIGGFVTLFTNEPSEISNVEFSFSYICE